MLTIHVRNVHRALPEGIRLLQTQGLTDKSRFGDVVVAPTPVTTVYQKPWERVVFWEQRDANPAFHLFEALWMLRGRNDVEWISYFNSGFARFSDDGKTYHGAYGHRWRRHFGVEEEFVNGIGSGVDFRAIDQLKVVVELLKNKPRTRRAIIQMWDCTVDLHPDEYPQHRDLPCNDIISVWRDQNDCLAMTVFCRSNDIIFGCYGSNAVHFSVLQEYLAAKVGIPMGPYYQISNNFHAYNDQFAKNLPLADEAFDPFRDRIHVCPYEMGSVTATPIVTHAESFDEELREFFAITEFKHGAQPTEGRWRNQFFPLVAIPMWQAYRLFKEGEGIERYVDIAEILGSQVNGLSYGAPDWIQASMVWMRRRRMNAEAKAAGKGEGE